MEGIYVYMWLSHTFLQQKSTQPCKAIILQFKIIIIIKQSKFTTL